MQPHLPLSNSINLSCSTDACVNDAKDDRFIRDKSAFYTRQFRHISASSNITHPKCCFFKINTDSMIAISVMALIFIGLFIGGISRQQKNCMLPLILLMIFSCVGLFGMFVIMITMTADNTNKRFTKYSTAANIITTR
uniref:Phosphoinositide-interacting protein n=1 Tax=Elaeophora elaphi TaxID=1147741 RepID=A0A0R3RZB0_9BILA